MSRLLVAEPIVVTAVRASPSDSIARHPPEIFQHAFLTNGKAATAPPAERWFLIAAVAAALSGNAAFFSIRCSFYRACHVRSLCICSSPHRRLFLLKVLLLPGFRCSAASRRRSATSGRLQGHGAQSVRDF